MLTARLCKRRCAEKNFPLRNVDPYTFAAHWDLPTQNPSQPTQCCRKEENLCLSMSLIGHGGSLRLTPRNRLHPSQHISRCSQDDDRLQLTLKTVIGTTSSSPNAFDSDASRHLFAHCAGPAAIVAEVHEDLSITQRLFRALSNVSPVNSTTSFYNSSTPPATPTRSRRGSPFKDGSYTNGIGPVEYASESPSNSRVQNTVREATCVSLSRQGNFLAVGEVNVGHRLSMAKANYHRQVTTRECSYFLQLLRYQPIFLCPF